MTRGAASEAAWAGSVASGVEGAEAVDAAAEDSEGSAAAGAAAVGRAAASSGGGGMEGDPS
jgi:hypothetical protein